MENILRTLKQNGKCTARELAQELGIEPAESVNALQRLERKELVWCINGYWQAWDIPPDNKQPAAARKQTVTDKLVELVVQHEPITSVELAKIARRNPKSVAATLTHAFAAGRVGRTGAKGFYVYTAPLSATKAFLNSLPRMGAKG